MQNLKAHSTSPTPRTSSHETRHQKRSEARQHYTSQCTSLSPNAHVRSPSNSSIRDAPHFHTLHLPKKKKDNPLPLISTKRSFKETSNDTTRIHLKPSIYASLYHIPPQPPVHSFPARYSLRRHPCPSSSCLGMNLVSHAL
jgi:hypothetical protein